jgi:hypothetical protein
MSVFFLDETIPSDLHEIHITVDAKNTEHFIDVCNQNSIKPIVIALGKSYLDPMTSHRYQGSIQGAEDEITRLVQILGSAIPPIPVIRIKAETTVSNPIVLADTGYYESHLSIVVPESDEARLRYFVGTIKELHLSSNAMKTSNAVKSIMATYRARRVTADKFTADKQIV